MSIDKQTNKLYIIMAGKIQWITFKGKDILFNDRSGLRNEAIMKNVDTAVETIFSCGKKDILYLIDNSDTIIVPDIKEYISKAAKKINPVVKKTAVVGPSKAQKILINLYTMTTGMNMKVFDDFDSAKNWLIK